MTPDHDPRGHVEDELDDHDRGLSHDLPTLLSRRRMLTLFGGVSMAGALAACSSGSDVHVGQRHIERHRVRLSRRKRHRDPGRDRRAVPR